MQEDLDEILKEVHPMRQDLKVEPAERDFRGFCGVQRPLQKYKQMYVDKFDMRGSAPQYEGQCFLPAITFAAGTIRVTPAVWRGIAMDVTFEELREQVYRQGYFLKDYHFSTVLDFFLKTSSGMWIMRCYLRGELHWIGYDGWRGVVYEPALDKLLILEKKDLSEKGVEKILEKLEIDRIVCYGQLWIKTLITRQKQLRNEARKKKQRENKKKRKKAGWKYQLRA